MLVLRVVACTVADASPFSSPFSFSALPSSGPGSPPRHARTASGDLTRALNSSSRSRERLGMASEDKVLHGEDAESPQPVSNSHPQQSWLRKLSSMASSHDSNVPSSLRSSSMAPSNSNASFAFSHAESTTPMFSDMTPAVVPPNKLVKRSSSLRSTSAVSPRTSSASKLPVLRRPATSHQRSATLQGRIERETHQREGTSMDSSPAPAAAPRFRQYFTPAIARDEVTSSKKYGSTGIPNPIKRIQPDRKYHPTLLLGQPSISRAEVQPVLRTDHIATDADPPLQRKVGVPVDSSPVSSLPSLQSPAEESPDVRDGFKSMQVPKRTFSIGNLLSSGPQGWKRQPAAKTSDVKSRSKAGRRTVSSPLASMGNRQSVTASGDFERPAKRRDLTDPQSSNRPAAHVAGQRPTTGIAAKREASLNATSSPVVFGSPNSIGSVSAFSPSLSNQPHRLNSRVQRLPSLASVSSASQPSRLSSAPSFGSGEVDDLDFQSDTVYDSVRTRATRTSSIKRGPPIDAIFDESPQLPAKLPGTTLQDLLREGSFREHSDGFDVGHSIIEEEEGISTPVKSVKTERVWDSPARTDREAPNFAQLPSSPPDVVSDLHSKNTHQDAPPDTDDNWWPLDDDGGDGSNNHLPSSMHVGTPDSGNQFLAPQTRQRESSPLLGTPQRSCPENPSTDTRSSIFDWSEQQRMEKSPGNHSPPRPKTVHGKKDAENRGSRPAGRRAPSGLHARSQSVPVVPDLEGKRSQVMTNKFGTWGVGTKGVTEDWNEDFDFDEAPATAVDAEEVEDDEKRVDSGLSMSIPKTIREQQKNVLANIGLLREWGSLIEDLKVLRIRAASLDMLGGRYTQIWKEVDAMIELADQDADGATIPSCRSPPSSPGFDYDAFDEHLMLPPTTRHKITSACENDIPEDAPFAPAWKEVLQGDSNALSPITNRPRKDSEAVARSVIEALQQKRSVSDSSVMLQPVQPAKKVPFDTATLKHIVPYVNGLMRQVKEAIRETEGLYSSPGRQDDTPEDPPFSNIFRDPSASPSARRKARRYQAATDHVMPEDSFQSNGDELAKHMKMMKVA
ncbi:hypothetical protein LTR50_006679 [Elasticomyces elasticus]|nr:hypothetical protein LTR50_006679 [Elasticomyces elasticus]